MFEIELALRFVTTFGAIGTCIGAWLAYRSLKANHDWQRRQYAIGILRDWNDITADHAKAIEKAFPYIRDIDRIRGAINEITRDQAKEIYTCDPKHPYWELRFHIVELLNHLEFIVAAYSQNVADQEFVTEVFKRPLIKWYNILKNFLEIVEQCEGNQPWELYVAHVTRWSSSSVKLKKKTA